MILFQNQLVTSGVRTVKIAVNRIREIDIVVYKTDNCERFKGSRDIIQHAVLRKSIKV